MEIRPLEGWEEYRACEELQRRVWGSEFSELAPGSLLKITARLGGVVSGAFDGQEGLVGFVFGVTGWEEGRPVHWSHMLGIREGWRDRGIGTRLKLHQREVLTERGVERASWTYDPLVARNAHFNLNRLGARVDEYVVDMYGESDSELHRGLGTDRFVVVWNLGKPTPPAGGEKEPAGGDGDPGDGAAGGASGAPRVNPDPGEDETAGEELPGADVDSEARADVVRVRIPSDILAVRERDSGEAAAWRRSTRDALVALLGAGWRVIGFDPDAAPGRADYHLARP